MRLTARVFVFVSTLFIILYGVLPGLFRMEGGFIPCYVAGENLLRGIDPTVFYRFPDFQKLIDISGLSSRVFLSTITTPSSFLLDSLIAIPPAAVSKFLVTAINAAALMLLVHVSARLARSSVKTAYQVYLSSSFALASNFNSNEPFIILTLLFVTAFYAFAMEADGATGFLLGLVFPFDAFAAIPAALLLLSKRWRVFVYFVVSCLLVFAISCLVLGESTIVFYVQRIFPFYINGKVQNPFSFSYQTAWSFCRRLFLYDATLNSHPLIASRDAYVLAISLFKAVVVVPSAYFFYRGVEKKNPRECLIAAAMSIIFLSPTGTTFHLVLLAPAIVCLAQTALDEGRTRAARLFIVLYALSCLPLYAVFSTYFKIESPFLLYERFFLLIILFVGYLVFESRFLSRRLLAVRTGIIGATIVAVAATLYFGDSTPILTRSSYIVPVLSGGELKVAAFSPTMSGNRIEYIKVNSGILSPTAGRAESATGDMNNCYRLSSDDAAGSYAIETSDNKELTSSFRTKRGTASFIGESATISRNGDFGAFLRSGRIYIADLRSKRISLIDSVDLLPFRITQCNFNAGRNFEIAVAIDSMNGSYSVGDYDLLTRKMNMLPIPFPVSLVCADGDNFYMTFENGDTTSVWVMKNGDALTELFSLHGNIIDINVLNHELYFSSDFERGLNLPTIYRYTAPVPFAEPR